MSTDTRPRRIPEAVETGRAALRRHRAPSRLRVPLIVAAICQLVWTLWWLAAYPAFLGPDSVAAVERVTGAGTWTADHAAGYDALVLVALRLTGGVAAVTLLQTVAMSVALAYAVSALARLGARARWTVPAAVALAVLPPTGTFVVFLWREVPFAVCAVLLFAASARLLARRAEGTLASEGRGRRIDLVVLFVALVGLGVFRVGGYGVVAVTALLLLFLLPGVRGRIVLLTAAALAVPLLLNPWGYQALLGLPRPGPGTSAHTLEYADVAVAYHRDPGLFSERDRAVLAEVAPLGTWDTAGDHCFSAAALTGAGTGWDADRAGDHGDDLLALWKRVALRQPDSLVGARICRGHLAWSAFSGPAARDGATVVPGPEASADLFGATAPGGDLEGSRWAAALRPHPVVHQLRTAAVWLHTAFRAPQLDWLFWRGATWCYLGYGALLVYARRRRLPAAVPVLGAVPLGLQLTVLAAGSGPDFRAMSAALFIGPLLLTLVGAGRART
ncbi:DUF6020 family protein [Kitasatospora cinereorecta]|uniref:DUF6020 family protein n=1 Tax=Kitasatospora cinereorecta TaxID=285560 RepID=A0ABW0VL61_9ACTN